MKKIIITSDDFGIDKETNEAVVDSFKNGVLASTCLIANGEAFDDANEIIKNNPDFDIGIHLNIIEGKSLTQTGKSFLTNNNGIFDKGYIYMLKNSYNREFLNQVETECRAQIEKILNAGIKPTYINSHVHTHSIPKLFELTCKLAKEYSIKNIRTQAEIPYYTRGLLKHFSVRYILNIIKNILLNTFTFINKFTVKKYGLYTNENFIGVLYTGIMDENTIISGIKRLNNDGFAEIIIHPSTNTKKIRHNKEYKALISDKLKQYIAENNINCKSWGDFN